METLTIKIERPAYGGISIGKHDGKIVMIKGALLPGEIAEVIIDNEKTDYISAHASRVLEPSPDRINPLCSYFGECGGCHLQHIPYNLQVQLKETILRDCLKRLAQIELALSEPIVNDNPWHYRLRGQFKLSEEGPGFYKEGTKDVVSINSCPIMTETIDAFLPKVKALVNGLKVKEVQITSGDCSIALMKTSARVKSKTVWERAASEFLASGFSGLFVETPDHKLFRYGKSFVTLDLGPLKYTVPPTSFFQSHWKLNNIMVQFIKDTLRPLEDCKILDLYAGSGNFSLPLAADAQVTAVEENLFSIETGKRNLKLNNISRYRFIRASAEAFYSKDHFDVIILDPPRSGLTRKAMNNVLALLPARIVYISCNPTTFARDLKTLKDKYDIESVRMIDLFPQTYHIEALAFLRLR